MNHIFLVAMILAAGALAMTANAGAATEDLGNGFAHHGVATPVSNHRGTVATAAPGRFCGAPRLMGWT